MDEQEGSVPAAAPVERAGPSARRTPADGERRAERGPQRRSRFYNRRRGRRQRRVCQFCVAKAKAVDYKDVSLLRHYLSSSGRIQARRKTGTCAGHQRMLSTAIKRARHIALLPFTAARAGQEGP